ncbi:histone-lysine N-methyltransferase SETMAR [Trichonephila clavipes]|uniref:Histone-lysine N-methyltransferase SETMAR n=1 Tax=Trichonephila clavipes TaxID=2585209 RepID=A0A8X6SZF4_TRICX|nr:histone-lysine N-methyltransferase SETMAR [Trichonephila clavipes]
MVKGTDSWLSCHEFEPSVREDSPCKGARHVKSVESSNVLPLTWYQLDRLKPVVDQELPELANRRGAVFHQDNASNDSPHTSVMTRQKLREPGWKVLMHPPCNSDLAPNDYRLFLPWQNFQSDKKLGSREDCENGSLEFFSNKGQDFYERGNMKLPLKWQQIVQQNGTYLTQIGPSETC